MALVQLVGGNNKEWLPEEVARIVKQLKMSEAANLKWRAAEDETLLMPETKRKPGRDKKARHSSFAVEQQTKLFSQSRYGSSRNDDRSYRTRGGVEDQAGPAPQIQHDSPIFLGSLSSFAGGCVERCNSPDTFKYSETGEGVTVYVVDGVRTCLPCMHGACHASRCARLQQPAGMLLAGFRAHCCPCGMCAACRLDSVLAPGLACIALCLLCMIMYHAVHLQCRPSRTTKSSSTWTRARRASARTATFPRRHRARRARRVPVTTAPTWPRWQQASRAVPPSMQRWCQVRTAHVLAIGCVWAAPLLLSYGGRHLLCALHDQWYMCLRV